MPINPFKRALSTMAAVLAPRAAEVPPKIDLGVFAGTWREDRSKAATKPGEEVVTYLRTPDNNLREIHEDSKERTYPLDGCPHPSPDVTGAMIAWKILNDSTLQAAITTEGELQRETTHSVSPNGKVLTTTSRARRPDGSFETITTVRERTSGERKGVWGTWRPLSFQMDVPAVMVIEVPAKETVSVSQELPQLLKFAARIDSKDYPVASEAPKTTVSASLTSSSGLQLTMRRDGAPVREMILTVSADGRTLRLQDREPGSAAAVTKEVCFERQ